MVVCSGEVPCLDGSWARDSFSTYLFLAMFSGSFDWETHGNLEVDKLLGECAHLVVEAERVVANLVRSEDKVTLALLLAVQNDLLVRGRDGVVDIKRATGLDLKARLGQNRIRGQAGRLTAK